MIMVTMSLFVGDLLIIIAQIISAVQFVYEEKFIKKHNFQPLLVVGLEGLTFCLFKVHRCQLVTFCHPGLSYIFNL